VANMTNETVALDRARSRQTTGPKHGALFSWPEHSGYSYKRIPVGNLPVLINTLSLAYHR
jgi:hypothetical protein